MGFSEVVTEPRPEKYIIVMAPHTSNWDFIIGILYAHAEGFRSNFLMKKEWFFWPLGPMFRRMGGIPVERSRHTSLTDQLAKLALESTHFSLAVTPEGTRSRNTEWKRGFYYIALKAKLPILLYGIDFATKTIVCKRTLIPSGDVETDMRIIADYFKNFKGKHPENFALPTFS